MHNLVFNVWDTYILSSALYTSLLENGMLLNIKRRTIKKLTAVLAAVLLFFLLSFHHSAFAANPYESDIVSWGSMQMLDQPAIAIAAGGYHSLALKPDGTVAAWGDGAAGQTNVPTGLGSVAAIAAGYYHSLALVVAQSAPPTLAISMSGSLTVLSWPTNAVGYGLQTTPSLTLPTWQAVTNAPVIVGDRYVLTNAWPTPAGFFRLRQH